MDADRNGRAVPGGSATTAADHEYPATANTPRVAPILSDFAVELVQTAGTLTWQAQQTGRKEEPGTVADLPQSFVVGVTECGLDVADELLVCTELVDGLE